MKNFLSTNEQLCKNQCLMSLSGRYKAIFQCDGNFVVYDCTCCPNKAVWASGTNGSDAVRVIMQADGNLVIYNQCNQPKWSSGTYISGSCNVCRLELTDCGKLVLTRNCQQVWCSC
ncbi:hypothetical protein PFLUV_G00039120 [Perca fluviatilis]|uniref:Bulb-type lectin domain-containing protein n=1 Tax=Perca fluviatilis TaxID=8168 RepID=A0A6A5FET4_PERFL|nr:mannose-specific lectin-like [Perca fluviatilis]KAF1391168.1 hypothetical protein PFLUV_G00039120 [Perca fluviatilis]